ncbi:UDP-N-acetylmuramoyl-tripeptide--D-alanyl-D-alanine ligase [Oscillibacter valericigenes]|uniref:UDP-N-acetylmuramoyl-tripeptide--D-alanyl-D- alanine ligase n=1 Tax=Oscillibacter valericigenes TaxID=351091 RepID=UPI001F28D897|nr:UDP-N-acetylmuramoyl-tripeptide--D-alanyl-D-alanine ligase [Oscillibacter valericigenes]MCF2664184.1 UDP-N-acetylmuramoyl-tripeptide--D-alanyl-D-alanine ligase [Oscillibacter valericigenes]
MQPMTIKEIAAAVNGVWWNPREDAAPVTAVCTDSRKITPGCLFLPWVGEKFDGHDFIDMALDKGAAGCLCAKLPQDIRRDKFYIKVDDTRLALRAMASAYRDKFAIPFVQITGSVGKTTTKEMIAAVLGAKYRTLKTPENFNNDIGTPLTLFGLGPEHEAAVIETGMNHFGEIEYLGALVRPDVAVISNIGDAHIEFLGSREGILKAKCEIFEHLKEGGLVVLNGDDALLNTVQVPFRTIRCGQSEHCQARITEIADHGVDGITCTVVTEKDTYALTVPAPGAYMAYSASIAVAVGEELGLSHEEIVRGVAAYEPAGSRMRVVHLPEGRILLDDCYNANPQSVTAALEVLAKTECDRRVAVLGDMGELGALTDQAHYNMGALAAMLGIDFVAAIGEKAARIADGTAQSGGEVLHFSTKEEALKTLKEELRPGTAMLVKASHAMHFGALVDALQEDYD